MKKKKQKRQRKAAKAAREPRVPKAAKAPARAPADGLVPVPKHGPTLHHRMRSQADIEACRKAAKKAGMSMNTWLAEVLVRAAEAQ